MPFPSAAIIADQIGTYKLRFPLSGRLRVILETTDPAATQSAGRASWLEDEFRNPLLYTVLIGASVIGFLAANLKTIATLTGMNEVELRNIEDIKPYPGNPA
jgi:hypothetical protein